VRKTLKASGKGLKKKRPRKIKKKDNNQGKKRLGEWKNFKIVECKKKSQCSTIRGGKKSAGEESSGTASTWESARKIMGTEIENIK